jgi:hypothetical protein
MLLVIKVLALGSLANAYTSACADMFECPAKGYRLGLIAATVCSQNAGEMGRNGAQYHDGRATRVSHCGT